MGLVKVKERKVMITLNVDCATKNHLEKIRKAYGDPEPSLSSMGEYLLKLGIETYFKQKKERTPEYVEALKALEALSASEITDIRQEKVWRNLA